MSGRKSFVIEDHPADLSPNIVEARRMMLQTLAREAERLSDKFLCETLLVIAIRHTLEELYWGIAPLETPGEAEEQVLVEVLEIINGAHDEVDQPA
jgi:hypothetical protein